MTTTRLIGLIAALACSSGNSAGSKSAQSSDSSFAKLQQRGATVMGVDQYTSQHVFEPLPTGGRIVLQRKENHSAGGSGVRGEQTPTPPSLAAADDCPPRGV